MRNCVLKSDV